MLLALAGVIGNCGENSPSKPCNNGVVGKVGTAVCEALIPRWHESEADAAADPNCDVTKASQHTGHWMCCPPNTQYKTYTLQTPAPTPAPPVAGACRVDAPPFVGGEAEACAASMGTSSITFSTLGVGDGEPCSAAAGANRPTGNSLCADIGAGAPPTTAIS